jgi:hypothetical protein
MFEIILGTVLLILYQAFWAWHSPWANKLTRAEIDHYMAIIEKLPLLSAGCHATPSAIEARIWPYFFGTLHFYH